jgi:hypothetical protein
MGLWVRSWLEGGQGEFGGFRVIAGNQGPADEAPEVRGVRGVSRVPRFRRLDAPSAWEKLPCTITAACEKQAEARVDSAALVIMMSFLDFMDFGWCLFMRLPVWNALISFPS